jgi:hypothetical protein
MIFLGTLPAWMDEHRRIGYLNFAGGLCTACWLLQFDVADMEVLRPSSRESPFCMGSQCSRFYENTASRTIVRTVVRQIPADGDRHSTARRLTASSRESSSMNLCQCSH